MDPGSRHGDNAVEVRLFVEELCCDLCRFEHVAGGTSPAEIRIDREFPLGRPGAYADLRVTVPGRPAYFLEVKLGHSLEMIEEALRRKYTGSSSVGTASKLVLVADVAPASATSRLSSALPAGLELEIWDESRLLELLRERFDVALPILRREDLVPVRHAIDRAKGIHAFGPPDPAAHVNDPLESQLLWHFGFWRLEQLRLAGRASARDILPPGTYRNVAIVLADLCGFSSYVRDTPNPAIAREALTSFYSKARYQIINSGGMLVQFVGDEVVAAFGVPDARAGFLDAALDTARSLSSIGASVSHGWQRRIDRVQASGGVHIGIALGDLEMVSLRPFSRTHIGAIGDSINLSARLMSAAGPGEIVVSNAFYSSLDRSAQVGFVEQPGLEAKNMGTIKAWRLIATRPTTG